MSHIPIWRNCIKEYFKHNMYGTTKQIIKWCEKNMAQAIRKYAENKFDGIIHHHNRIKMNLKCKLSSFYRQYPFMREYKSEMYEDVINRLSTTYVIAEVLGVMYRKKLIDRGINEGYVYQYYLKTLPSKPLDKKHKGGTLSPHK